MSYPYGMQQPQKQGQPVWLWILVGVAGLAVVAMIVVLLVDFGGDDSDEGSQIAQGNTAGQEGNGTTQSPVANSTNSSPSNTSLSSGAGKNAAPAGSPFLKRLLAASAGGSAPYALQSSVPQDDQFLRSYFLGSPHEDQFLMNVVDRVAGSIEFHSEFWDIKSGKKLRAFAPQEQRYTFHANGVSPDGKWISSNGDDAVLLLNTQTGALKSFLEREFDDFGTFHTAFAENSSLLITARNGHKLVAWDIATGQIKFEHDGPDLDRIHALALLPGGKNVIYFVEDSQVLTGYYVVNYESGDVIKHGEWQHSGELPRLFRLPDGKRIVVDTFRVPAVVLEIESGRILATWPDNWSPKALMPGGDSVLSSDDTGKVGLFNLNTFGMFGSWMAHSEAGEIFGRTTHGVDQAAVCGDGTSLATLGPDGTLRFWSLR